MRRTPKERACTVSAIVNSARTELVEFTQATFTKFMQEKKCPYGTSVFSILRQKNLILLEGDKWVFRSKEPIHYSILQLDIDKLADSAKQYTENWKKKNESKELIEIHTISLEQAIAIIKEHGGKVLMPTTTFEEV